MLKKFFNHTLNYCFLGSNTYKNKQNYPRSDRENLKLFFESKTFKKVFSYPKKEIWFFFRKIYYSYTSYNELVKQLLLLNYFNKTYKANRMVYNLYITKKKTHSRSKKLKLFNKLFNICYENIEFFKSFKFSIKKISMLFYSEYVNSIWYFNWWFEWNSSRNKRIETTKKNPFKKWKYDLNHLNLRRILHFITLKKKKKHNRRKFTTPKDSYNTGFLFGFTKHYFTKIFVNLQIKSIKNKNKKNKKIVKNKKKK